METAVSALLKYQEKTGVIYAKKGLIISYSTGENKMDTKQFQGEVTDIGEVGLWSDFGGGSKMEAKDEPERMARMLSPLEAHTRTFRHRSRWTPRPREWSSFNLPIQRVRASVTNNSSLLAQAAVVALVPL